MENYCNGSLPFRGNNSAGQTFEPILVSVPCSVLVMGNIVDSRVMLVGMSVVFSLIGMQTKLVFLGFG